MLVDPAIKLYTRDGRSSSGDINIKLLSNDDYARWAQLGKQSPGYCWNWFMHGRCEHGERCVWRHIKPTPKERADQAYWNPVLLAHWDLVDARRNQSASELTQLFPGMCFLLYPQPHISLHSL